MMKMFRNQKGFTLIELMIVVIILAILAVFAIPRFMTSRQQAQQATCRGNMRMINDAAGRWSWDNNNGNPANINALVPQYLDAAPTCPGFGLVAGAAYTWNAPVAPATVGNATCATVGSGH